MQFPKLITAIYTSSKRVYSLLGVPLDWKTFAFLMQLIILELRTRNLMTVVDSVPPNNALPYETDSDMTHKT